MDFVVITVFVVVVTVTITVTITRIMVVMKKFTVTRIRQRTTEEVTMTGHPITSAFNSKYIV